jgi:hypothetical protein
MGALVELVAVELGWEEVDPGVDLLDVLARAQRDELERRRHVDLVAPAVHVMPL